MEVMLSDSLFTLPHFLHFGPAIYQPLTINNHSSSYAPQYTTREHIMFSNHILSEPPLSLVEKGLRGGEEICCYLSSGIAFHIGRQVRDWPLQGLGPNRTETK